MRLSPRYSVAGRYSFEHNELFDEQFTEDEKPLIDRLFPQVRLSKFAGSLLRDSRDDVLDAEGGTLLVGDDRRRRARDRLRGRLRQDVRRRPSRIAGCRARGASCSRSAPASARRTGSRVPCRVSMRPATPIPGPDGEPIVDVVQDLPASERFFAGGDTTVRGFSLDRLGTTETISPTGFPHRRQRRRSCSTPSCA